MPVPGKAKNTLDNEYTTCPLNGLPFDIGHCGLDESIKKAVCNVQCKHLFGAFFYDAGDIPQGQSFTFKDLADKFTEGSSTTTHTCFGGIGKCKRCKATIIDRTNVFESDWGECERQARGEQKEGCLGPGSGPAEGTPGEDITMDKFVGSAGKSAPGDHWDPNRQTDPNSLLPKDHAYCVDCCDNKRVGTYMNITTIRECELEPLGSAQQLCEDPLFRNNNFKKAVLETIGTEGVSLSHPNATKRGYIPEWVFVRMHWAPTVYYTLKNEWQGRTGTMPESTSCRMSLSLCGGPDYSDDVAEEDREYVLTNYTLLIEVKERRAAQSQFWTEVTGCRSYGCYVPKVSPFKEAFEQGQVKLVEEITLCTAKEGDPEGPENGACFKAGSYASSIGKGGGDTTSSVLFLAIFVLLVASAVWYVSARWYDDKHYKVADQANQEQNESTIGAEQN